MKMEIKLKMLVAHPLNRKFETSGAVWDDFCESVRTHGVVESLFVRPKGKKYEVLAGHRRLAAALAVGTLSEVPCEVMELNDCEALVFLMNSNLQRAQMSVMDEAMLVREIVEMRGMEEDELLRELSRDKQWLRVRQAVFGFDYEVQDAIASGRLSEGAFREVLMAPEELQEKALEVVMGGGEQFDEPLSEERAREFIQFSLIPEWEKECEWESNSEKVRKQVTKDLGKLCNGAPGVPTVLVLPWGKGADGLGGDLVSAKELVPIEYVSPDEEAGKSWAYCAACVGAPIYVLAPDAVNHDKRLLVSRKVLLDDAAARASHGMKSGYLMAKPGAKKSTEAVTKALHVLEGEGEKDFQEEEPLSEVATPGHADGMKIEQKMEHHVMIDMGAVKKLAMWAVSEAVPVNPTPKFVPAWALTLESENRLEMVDEICNWVHSLKTGGGK